MNEPWKRLIEAERRVMRLESLLQRQNTQIVSVAGAVRNDGQNVTNPFGSGGGGGGIGAVHRFSESLEVWVEWATTPTVKAGASSNPTADVTALAEAISFLEVGVTLDLETTNTEYGLIENIFLYDTGSSRAAMYLRLKANNLTSISGSMQFYTCDVRLSLFDDGEFLIDPDYPGSPSGALFRNDITTGIGDELNSVIAVSYPRRNGIGSVIGGAVVAAYRTEASGATFGYGPTYGESGTWSFAMECPETTYINAGNGTLYVRWGDAAASIVSGGTPDALPTDIISGGSPASLPTDIIDGGTI